MEQPSTDFIVTENDATPIWRTLGLLASTIKSGEAWSDHCEENYQAAKQSLTKITSDTYQDKIKTVMEVMAIFNGFSGPSTDVLWWRLDGEYAPVTMIVNCNDLFFWGSADAETILPEDVSDLKNAVSEVLDKDPTEVDMAPYLWICRKRKMRPQNAFYKYIPFPLQQLFDDAGEERVVGAGNPAPRPTEPSGATNGTKPESSQRSGDGSSGKAPGVVNWLGPS